MNIDLKARIRNKAFWVAMASAIALLIQQLGFKNILPDNYSDIINSILTILTMLGIIIDTSTPGVADIQANVEAKISDDNSIDASEVKSVQAVNGYVASSKISVDNPDNIQAIGQEVNHISANMPQ